MAAQEYRCTVTKMRMLTPTVFELFFEAEGPISTKPDAPPVTKGMPFAAGQFVSIVIPGAGPKGRDLRRAYSIASPPESYPIELCVKLVEEGPGTNYLYSLRPGDSFRGFAPYGDFVYEPKPGRHAVFIATGTGVAPFRAMVLSEHYKAAPPVSATCLLGVRQESELLYLEMSEIPGLKNISIVSQPQGKWDGFKGRVTDYIRTLPTDFPWLATDYYLCGNGAMITEVKEILAGKSVDKDSIHQEKYY